MRVFVTGGSGFVGGHVAEALAADHEVIALARSDRSAAKVEALGAVAAKGSLETVDAELLDGVDAIVHAAAFVEEYGPAEAFWKTNVDGTQRLLDAAREAGVRRFVHISSNATVFDGNGQLDVDESAAVPGAPSLPYCVTKGEAERRVLAADSPELHTVSLRPCFIWGPRDTSVLPAVARMAKAGSFTWVNGGRATVSTTHVANLVAGVLLALDGKGDGQAFFLADDGDVTLHDFLTGLASTIDVELPERSLPASLVRGAAWAMESTWHAFGATSPPPVTILASRLMSADMTVDTSRARTTLGWAPVIDRTTALAELAAAPPPLTGTTV